MKRKLLMLVGLPLAVAAIGPYLVPVRPLKGLHSPEELADPDSHFVDLKGLRVHYKTAGAGEPSILLLHPFASSTFTWHEVMARLAELGTVVAFDRPGFGLTSRPMPGEWRGDGPYGLEANADLTVALMDKLGIRDAVLVGSSAGGTVAVLTALRYPQRVRGLVLVDAAIYRGGAGGHRWARLLVATPQARHLGPLLARSITHVAGFLLGLAWHDVSRLTPDAMDGYRKPFEADNWDRGLWEAATAFRPGELSQRLPEINVPVLVITGDDDRIVPTAESIRVADEIPGARLVVIPECGHVPQEECAEAFMDAVRSFVARVEGKTG